MNASIALRLSGASLFYVKNFLQNQQFKICECKQNCKCQNLIAIIEPRFLKGFGMDHKNIIVLTSTIEEDVDCCSNGLTICHRKPINFRLLSAQIYSVLKESRKNYLSYRNIKLDHSSQSIYKNDQELRLTRSEFNFLSILIRKKGSILTKSEVCTKVIEGNVMSYRAIDTLVSRLRKKVEELNIETIYGMGFRLRE